MGDGRCDITTEEEEEEDIVRGTLPGSSGFVSAGSGAVVTAGITVEGPVIEEVVAVLGANRTLA
jgi:hypothetical protein